MQGPSNQRSGTPPAPRSVPPYVSRRSEVSDFEPPNPHQSQWLPVVKNGNRAMGPRPANAHIVSTSEMNATNNLEGPCRNPVRTKKRPSPPRMSVKQRSREWLFYHWSIPHLLRLIQWLCSLAALILGRQLTRYPESQTIDSASAWMAMIVGAIALVYVAIVWFLEASKGPVGQHSIMHRVQRLLLDLLFIVVGSLNLSLAFATACYHPNTDPGRQARRVALAGVLLGALVAWLVTFVVNMLR
ncbi:MAG: hypothetical protein L6R42_001869 [Xanthoria sp. 1 TBL-2021]|nr:MAG: hypothetical protein L6R42_001869 [Xanthoria sp. 1 TBL-2021]